MLGLIIGDIAGVGAIERGVPAYGRKDLFNVDSVFGVSTVTAVSAAEWLVVSGEKGIMSAERLGLTVKQKADLYSRVQYPERVVPVLFNGNGLPNPSKEIIPDFLIGLTTIGSFINDPNDIKTMIEESSALFSLQKRAATFALVYSMFVYYLLRYNTKRQAVSALYDTFELLVIKRSFGELEREEGDPSDPEDVFLRAFAAFMETDNFEDAIRAGTMLNVENSNVSALTGAFAEAFYKDISHDLISDAFAQLPEDAWQWGTRFYSVLNAVYFEYPERFRNIYENM